MTIAKEGWPIAGTALAAALAATALGLPWLAAALAASFLFTLWFFRDPERPTPNEPDGLISPADGRVIKSTAESISIFMNVFNVHVCRAPAGGTVASIEHRPGRFVSAFRDAASEHNEQTALVIADGDRRIRFRLVAGLVARRIVCRVKVGQRVVAGQRIGLIRFGSRVDLELPQDCRAAVRTGERVWAGRTVIARRSAVDATDRPTPLAIGYSGIDR